jgi:hypothetical protein
VFVTGLDDLEEKEDEDDGEDEAKTASTVVAEAGTHTVAAKTEQQDQNDEKNQHYFVSVCVISFLAWSEMQILPLLIEDLLVA